MVLLTQPRFHRGLISVAPPALESREVAERRRILASYEVAGNISVMFVRPEWTMDWARVASGLWPDAVEPQARRYNAFAFASVSALVAPYPACGRRRILLFTFYSVLIRLPRRARVRRVQFVSNFRLPR
jgi:hypothetical protein